MPATPATPSNGGVGRPLVVVLGLIASFGPLSIDVYLPALPGVGADLGADAGAVGLTVTACLVGLGVGQLIVGPLSDRYGRRPLLLVGVAVFTACSLGCALAPTLPVLVVARFLQALGGSAGIVLSRAIARDLRSGAELARLFALLVAVNALAPILAPLLGGQLLRFTSWRGSFVALALVGVVISVACAVAVPESLARGDRQRGGLGAMGRSYAALLGDRTFLALTAAGAMVFATLLAYITASPFVLQDVYGLGPQVYSAVFAGNALVLLVGARLGARVPLVAGTAVLLAGSVTVLATGPTGAGLPAVLVGFALITLGTGLTTATLTALAMEEQAARAGAASAVLGAAQFGVGGLAAALASRGASAGTTALGTSLVIASTLALALAVRAVRTQGEARPPRDARRSPRQLGAGTGGRPGRRRRP